MIGVSQHHFGIALALSTLLHGLIFLPLLSGWLYFDARLTGSPNSTPVRLRLVVAAPTPPPVIRPAGQPTGRSVPVPGPGGARRIAPVAPRQPARTDPMAPARAKAPPMPQPQQVAGPAAGYPTRVPSRRPPAPKADVPVGEGFDAVLDPPVLLKGPRYIPIPPFLRNRQGHFRVTLRCQVAPDGSTRVAVMDGTGAPDLDESVRASFSELPWYRAELAGQPVAVTVRLVIEGHWESGQENIDWGGRIPRPEL